MSFHLMVLLIALLGMTAFLIFYVRLSFGLSSTLICLILLLHGPSYIYYTRQWGLGRGFLLQVYQAGFTGPVYSPEVLATSLAFRQKIQNALIDGSVVASMDLALALSFVALCIGIWMADRVFRCPLETHRRAMKGWAIAAARHEKESMPAVMRFLVVMAVIFLVYFLIAEGQIQKSIIYLFERMNFFEKVNLRRSMGASNSYIFNLMLNTVFVFIAFYAWSLYRDSSRVLYFSLSFFLIALILIAKLATLSKAPAAIFVLQLIVLEFFRRSLGVKILHVFLIGVVASLLFVLMSFIAASDLGHLKNLALYVFYRVFMIPNEGLLEYFIVFPNVLDHTSGRDIRALAALLGEEPLRASYWRVAEVLRLVPGATTVVMFVADAWAAWAWKGVALVSLVFGFLVRLLDIELIVKRGRSSAVIAGICLGHFGVFIGMTTAFQTAVLSGGLAFVLPLVVLARSNGVFLDPIVLAIKSFYLKIRHGNSTM